MPLHPLVQLHALISVKDQMHVKDPVVHVKVQWSGGGGGFSSLARIGGGVEVC